MSSGKSATPPPERNALATTINNSLLAREKASLEDARQASEMGVDGPLIIRSGDARISSMQWAQALYNMSQARVGPRESYWRDFATLIQSARHFDFGEVEAIRFKTEGRRAAELMESGHLGLPFQSVVYWYNVELDDGQQYRVATLAARVRDDSTGHLWTLIADFYRSDAKTHAMLDPGAQFKFSYVLEAAGVFRADKDGLNKNKWTGNIIDTLVPPEDAAGLAAQASSLADGVAVLSLILNTKGIPKEVEEPKESLQKKRESNGKLRLPTVTHVDTRYYRRADANRGGHHASPVPHLRRGHIRRYKSGQGIWIQDCLVNCTTAEQADAAQAAEHSYVVEHD